MSFRTTNTTKLIEPQKWLFSSYCPNCSKPVGAIGDWVHRPTPGVHTPAVEFNAPHYSHHMLRDLQVTNLQIWPKVQKPVPPEHISAELTRVFSQAENCRQRREHDAAGMCYRRALDLSIQERRGTTTGNLKKDIQAFATSHGLTAEIVAWADLIRVIGNDVNHDPGEPNDEEIEDLATFTRVFLEYVFTLPEQVRIRLEALKAKVEGA